MDWLLGTTPMWRAVEPKKPETCTNLLAEQCYLEIVIGLYTQESFDAGKGLHNRSMAINTSSVEL